MFELAAQLDGVRQVAVVPERELAFVAVDHDGLRVDQDVVAGSGIARVPDRSRAGQMRHRFRRENFLHVSERFVKMQIRAVGGRNAGGFLPAMLQRVKAEIGELRGFGMAEYAEHSTVIVEVIVLEDVDAGGH